MKIKNKFVITGLILIAFLSGCSELKEDAISQPDPISVHPEGFEKPAHPNFHGEFIKEAGWNMLQCRSCHGGDYNGANNAVSCRTCHTGPDGPESCNTCHGSFGNIERIAPPQDANGNTETINRGVGAHSMHLYDNEAGNAVACGECHLVPQKTYTEGHLDTALPAEVIFGDLAKAHAGNPAYNAEQLTCENVYCHGSFEFLMSEAVETNRFIYTADKMTGNNKTVKWTDVGNNEAACGTCHGLPPQGHLGAGDWGIETCVTCHWQVVDASGKIIDKTKHINGVADAR